MKQTIITKLFNGEPLEGAEAAYVANNLKGETENPVILPPYDHEHKMTHNACGLTEKDIDGFCEIMKALMDKRDETKGISGMVEYLEGHCKDNPLMVRMIALQFLKAMASRNPLAMLLGSLLK